MDEVEVSEIAELVKPEFIMISLIAVINNVPEVLFQTAVDPKKGCGSVFRGNVMLSFVSDPTRLLIVIVDKAGILQFACRVTVMVVINDARGKLCPIILTSKTGIMM